MRDLGNGKFQFEVSKGHTGGGKRNKAYKTIQAKGKTPEAQQKYAEKQLALFVAEVESGNFQAPTKYTFAQYSEEWKKSKERELAPLTFYRYCNLLRLHIIPEIGGYKLEEINALLLDTAYNNMRELKQRKYRKKDGTEKIKDYSLSEQTIKHIHRLIGTILQTAFRKGLIKENPITRTDVPHVKKKEPKYYDQEQISSLIAALEDTDIQFKTAVHVTLASGCRLGELLGLEWSDIDYDKCTIDIRQAGQYIPGQGVFTKDPKNETSKRIVSMPRPVMDMISHLEYEKKVSKVKLGNKWQGGNIKDKAEREYDGRPNRLFTRADGSPMYPNRLSKQWKAFIDKSDLPKITFHGLRHTSASYLISCGQDVVSVAKRLGHSSSNTTLSIYAHAFKKRDEEAAVHMDKLYPQSEDKQQGNKAN